MQILFVNFASQNSSTNHQGHQIHLSQLQIGMDYETYGIIVIPSDLSSSTSRSATVEHSDRAIIGKLRIAQEKGSHLCLLLKQEALGPIAQGIILQNIGVARDDKLRGKMIAETPEMTDLMKIYGNTSLFFQSPSYDESTTFQPIVRNYFDPNIVHCLVENSNRGILFILSAYPPSQDEFGFARRLIPALISQIEKLQLTSNPISGDFLFSKEKNLVETKIDLEQRLDRLKTEMTKYQARKNILFLRDDPLANALPGWIHENLGVTTKREEKYIEDFWLTKADEDIAICEAKGLSKNVRREHVTQLIQSRQRRDLADDFPAVLIVNTFAAAETVHEKDKQKMPSDVIHWAVKNNILVIRTLDLIRLADLIELEKLTHEQVLEYLLKSLGWLIVTKEYEIQEIKE